MAGPPQTNGVLCCNPKKEEVIDGTKEALILAQHNKEIETPAPQEAKGGIQPDSRASLQARKRTLACVPAHQAGPPCSPQSLAASAQPAQILFRNHPPYFESVG